MTESGADAEHRAIHTALWKMATGCEISGLTQTILGMRARTQETNSVRAAVNTNAIVEVAARHREPAEIAELVAKFAGEPGAEYLARLALDAAAAQRATITLAALAGELRRHGLLYQAATLLAAVVRRRLPRDIARLLTDLSTRSQTGLVGMLIDGLARDDRVFVILCLRADDRLDLAEWASKRMATVLAPDELADLIRGLHAHQDGGSVDVVIRGALGRDLDQLAELIGTLSANRDDITAVKGENAADKALAGDIVGEAIRQLPTADRLVLASLLNAGIWPAGAPIIWDATVPGIPHTALIDILTDSRQRFINTADIHEVLRKAAETHPIERVAVLAREVEAEIPNGEGTVLDTVVTSRSVTEIFQMADELYNNSYGLVAWKLLDEAATKINKRADGATVAEFIDRLMIRFGELKECGPFKARRIGLRRTESNELLYPIIERVAKEQIPAQVMGLIAGLTERHRYSEFRGELESKVAEYFDGQQLAALPLIRRRDHLPAVLEIELKACQTPKFIKPKEVPGVVLALMEVGTTKEDLDGLLTYIGGSNLDYDAIAHALQVQGLGPQADRVMDGHRHPPPRPRFLK